MTKSTESVLWFAKQCLSPAEGYGIIYVRFTTKGQRDAWIQKGTGRYAVRRNDPHFVRACAEATGWDYADGVGYMNNPRVSNPCNL